MTPYRLAASAMLLSLVVIGMPPASSPAQERSKVDPKREEAIQKIQKLLDEQLIESKDFQKEMPLAKFLELLEKQLPKEKRISMRIDEEAFGHKVSEVAATPMVLPASPKKVSLRRVLEVALAKTKTKTDYRIGTKDLSITTPQRALYAADYDIRCFLGQPDPQNVVGPAWNDNIDFRNSEPTKRAALVVQLIFSAIAPESWKSTTPNHGTIQVMNGTRLAIRANAARHMGISNYLQALRRLGDIAVFMNPRLYEVDGAFYTRVKNAKSPSKARWEELERQFLADIPSKGKSLFDLLEKQEPILVGDEPKLDSILEAATPPRPIRAKIDNNLEAAILSLHRAISCMASPDQVRKGEDRQTVLEGVSLLAGIQVSADRRYVRVKLTEKAVELQEIQKVKVLVAPGKEVDAEVPFVKQSTHSQVLDIPDGASILIAVQFRPRALQAKDRWWVLSITPRIWIEEEERQILKGNLPPIPRP